MFNGFANLIAREARFFITMKKYIFYIALALMSCLFFSCQEESAIEDNARALATESELTSLLISITAVRADAGNVNTDCITMHYPITILGYNSGFSSEQTYILTNDAEFNAMLTSLSTNDYYTISYPVRLKINGIEIVSAGSNQLRAAIVSGVELCNE